MATLLEFKVKGNTISFPVDKLTPEVQQKMLAKGCARSFFERETGKKDSTPETLQAAIAKVQADPNSYYAAVGVRGEGTSRPKLNIYERKAKSWFNAEFLPALKLGVEKAQSIWAKSGGNGLLLTAKQDASEQIKATVKQNQEAREKLIAAKAKKLEKDGWEPEL